MENTLQTAVKQKALATHARIMANGQIMQNTLLEICKDLKAMRDERLYLELNYQDFESYVEQEVGIKQRQAYSYIATYERLGEKYLEDNASLGITKLELISQISSYERDEVLEDINVEDVSVRELKDTIENYKKQTEQLTFQLNEKNAELEKVKAEPAEPDQAAIQQAIENAQKENVELINSLKEKVKKAKSDKQSDINKAVEKAVSDQKKQIDKLKSENEKLKQQKSSLDDKLAKAEQQAKVTGADPNVIKLKIYFDDLQTTLGKISELLSVVSGTDAETEAKLKTAIISFLQSTASDLGGNYNGN